jgi:archaellum component FlaD/FlaE
MGIFGGNPEDEEAFEEAFGFDEVPEGESPFAEVPPPEAAPPPPPPPPAGQPPEAAPPPAPAPAPMPAAAPAAVPARDMTLEGTAPMVRSQSGLERLDSVEQSLSDIVRRVDLLDKSTEDIRSDIARVRDSIASMEGDMRELTSLYDLISTQINPFIEAEMEARASITAMEEEGEGGIPELDALFEPTPEIAAEGEEFGDIFAEAEEGEEEAIFAPFEEVPEGMEAPIEAVVEAVPKKIARLTKIGDAPTCHIALLRWIEFMLDTVPRRDISNLLSFYVKIGWISTGIKSEVIDIIRGVAGEEAEEAPAKTKKRKGKREKAKDKDGDVVMTYDKEELHELARTEVRRRGREGVKYDSWKMSPEDHLKSLILIERIRGVELNKEALEELERDVAMLKEGLDDFFAL